MNKLEAKRAGELALLLRAKEIQWWAFEPMRLKLAANTTYTPDFIVLRSDGSVVAEETKGFFRDDARVKIKVAATLYPWITFNVYEVHGKGWKVTHIPATEPNHE